MFGGGFNMNIFENIQPAELRLRHFITKEHYEDDSRDIKVPVIKLVGTDPVSQKIDQYNIGYSIRFSLTSCMDLTELIELNELIAVFDDQDGLQIGDDRGFRIVGMNYMPMPELPYYVYQFQTDKPNKVPFKKNEPIN